MKTKDTRLRCPCCGIATWMTDYVAFMCDHDRPDGRVCRKAQREMKSDVIPWDTETIAYNQERKP